jgi:fatty acid desaturase
MKAIRLIGHDLDDAVVNIAFFFLVLVATMAALDLASPWVVLGCWVLYVTIGFVIVVLLPEEQETRHDEQGQPRSTDQALVPSLPATKKPLEEKADRLIPAGR